ncbi:MAG: FtsX-like permease family protein [Cyclobacteriaceae bacterium]
MKLPLFIAKRYFLSRKKKTFINVISLISMIVVGLSTMALVIVLSVFNGLEGLLRNLYGTFDADITILPVEGKSFELTGDFRSQLEAIPGVEYIAEVIEDNVLVAYRGSQRIVRLKGVSEDFQKQGRFESAITYGDMKLREENVGFAIVGRGIQYDLNMSLTDDFHPLVINYPRDIGPGQVNVEKMFSQKVILPGGVFAVERSLDNNYIFVPLQFSQELLDYGNRRTALELSITPNVSLAEAKSTLEKHLGPSFIVKKNDELHSSLYRILKWEKIFVFLTFGLIIAIGSVNIYFSLSMLVIDKKKDLAVLKALGAPADLLRKTFMTEGSLIAFSGAFIGLLLGLLIAGVQQEFGLVGMGVPGAISDAYPVKIEWLDVVLTAFVVVFITILSSLQPARKAAKSLDLNLLQ